MSKVRTKAEVEELIEQSAAYREDIQFIQETLAGSDVFVGQFSSRMHGDVDVSVSVTVGMFMHGLPELVFSGVPGPIVQNVVSSLCDGNDFDREFLAGARSKVIHGFTVVAVPIDSPKDHSELDVCNDFYTLIDKDGLRAVQLVFSDEQGAFPWSRTYSEADRQFQPVLGMRMSH